MSENKKVIHAFGDPLPGEPDPDIVAALEDLLKKAKSGNVKGLAYVISQNQSLVQHGFVCTSVQAPFIAVGLFRLLWAFGKKVDNVSDVT